MKEVLTLEKLFTATREFCNEASYINFCDLIGTTDGKAVGTFVEHRLQQFLSPRFDVTLGNSASGIDLPDGDINTDIKVTSYKQPQSSCPYKSSRQKIFGLGYNLLVLVYDKQDAADSCYLKFLNCTFIRKERTADFTTTKRLIEMKQDGAIKEDIIAYFVDRGIPGDEIMHEQLAGEVMEGDIIQGYLTISNALQWRLQYKRVIALKNEISGISNYEIEK